jgi:hypothetical protein
VVKGGFQVVVKAGAERQKAQEAAEAMKKRLGLGNRLDDYCRLTFRDGNSFIELAVERSGQIVELTRKPTLLMRRAAMSMTALPIRAGPTGTARSRGGCRSRRRTRCGLPIGRSSTPAGITMRGIATAHPCLPAPGRPFGG